MLCPFPAYFCYSLSPNAKRLPISRPRVLVDFVCLAWHARLTNRQLRFAALPPIAVARATTTSPVVMVSHIHHTTSAGRSTPEPTSRLLPLPFLQPRIVAIARSRVQLNKGRNGEGARVCVCVYVLFSFVCHYSVCIAFLSAHE